MRLGALILARLSSSRLPGKVLREVGGEPLLAHVMRRAERLHEADTVAVATSDDESDDALASFALDKGWSVFRGSLEDVAARVLGAAQAYRLDALARINADSPWVDAPLIDEAFRLMRHDGYDLVTNVQERTFPYGIAAEVMTTEALERAHSESGPADREHVTRFIYEHPDRFRIHNLRSPDPSWAQLRLTVDDEDDLARFAALHARLRESAAEASTEAVVAAARELERSQVVRRDSRS